MQKNEISICFNFHGYNLHDNVPWVRRIIIVSWQRRFRRISRGKEGCCSFTKSNKFQGAASFNEILQSKSITIRIRGCRPPPRDGNCRCEGRPSTPPGKPVQWCHLGQSDVSRWTPPHAPQDHGIGWGAIARGLK